MKAGARYELGDHPTARTISAHYQAVRALRALRELEDTLGRDLHPSLQDQVRTVRRDVERIERRAAALRSQGEPEQGRIL